jgi:hypothetical protein
LEKRTTNTDGQFTLGGEVLEIVDNFKYLGVLFCTNGSLRANVKELFKKATNAMYGVIGKCRKRNLSIDCILDMVEKNVKPVFLHGCEMCGFNKSPLIEKLYLKLCKHSLHLKPSTPNFMISVGLGRYPIVLNIKVRMINIWCKLHNSHGNELSYKLFYELTHYNNAWCSIIESILNGCGLSYI